MHPEVNWEKNLSGRSGFLDDPDDSAVKKQVKNCRIPMRGGNA